MPFQKAQISSTPHLDTALGEWRGEDPIGPLQAPSSSKGRPSGRATEHKAPAGAGVEIQRGHTSCA